MTFARATARANDYFQILSYRTYVRYLYSFRDFSLPARDDIYTYYFTNTFLPFTI